jgi:hypothetical protein
LFDKKERERGREGRRKEERKWKGERKGERKGKTSGLEYTIWSDHKNVKVVPLST